MHEDEDVVPIPGQEPLGAHWSICCLSAVQVAFSELAETELTLPNPRMNHKMQQCSPRAALNQVDIFS